MSALNKLFGNNDNKRDSRKTTRINPGSAVCTCMQTTHSKGTSINVDYDDLIIDHNCPIHGGDHFMGAKR